MLRNETTMDRILRDVATMMRKVSNATRDRRRLNVAGRRNDAVAINMNHSGNETRVMSHQSVHVTQHRGTMSDAVAESTSAHRSTPARH